jgi:hypothetical protein
VFELISNYTGIPANEIREIEDFPGYFITSTGMIISAKGKQLRVLKPWITNHGHLVVRPSRDGIRKTVYIHQQVLRHFSGERPSQNHVGRHLDGNCLNNSITNLEWSTKAENIADRKRHGTDHIRPVTDYEAQMIRALKQDPTGPIFKTFSNQLLGRLLGISPRRIADIVNEKIQRDVEAARIPDKGQGWLVIPLPVWMPKGY